jgi:hypothetical protein
MVYGLLGQTGQHAMLCADKGNVREPETAANLRTEADSAKELARKWKNVFPKLMIVQACIILDLKYVSMD